MDCAASTAGTRQPLRRASSRRWKVSATQHPSEVRAPRRRARRTSFSNGFAALLITSALGIYNGFRIAQMRRVIGIAVASTILLLIVYVGYISVKIERQSTRDEAQPADVIIVLGAAEYRGKPSPVLRARLDHALDLYRRGLAPRILTTGGAGGDPLFTEGGVG